MLRNALKRVRAIVDPIIAADDFPDGVQPDRLRAATRDYPTRGGKRLRPALVLWSCGALGGDPKRARRAAAATEIYHNWTLVHDDIIDDDSTRRGAPTAHVQLAETARRTLSLDEADARSYGTGMAILAGDVQQGWAANSLLKLVEDGLSPEIAIALSRRLQEMVNRRLISGEALDVEFSRRSFEEITTGQVEKMLAMKTGALLRFCAESGAAVALNETDLSTPRVAALGAAAEAAGVAFQLKDDWLGLFGDETILGKPVCSDLRERKPTTLMIAAVNGLGAADARELRGFLGRKAYSEGDVARVRELVRSSGAERTTLARADELADRARRGFASLPDNDYRRLLEAWTDFLVKRSV